MMQWLRNTPPPAMERRVVEPGATFSLFENHWHQLVQVMENSQDAEGALTVISHLSQMIMFLRVSRGEHNTETSCKKFWLQHRCSEKVIKWLHNLQINGLQLHLDMESKLVAVLHSLCEIAARDSEILGYINETEEREDWDGAYSLAALLLQYSLRSDPELGDTARYSFTLLIQIASKFSGLEKSLTQESGLGLTNVVISGLSACFSQLPTFADSSPEQLQAFIVQLKFVEDVTEAASDSVAATIAECFSNAFLITVIQPALTQDEGSRSLHPENDPYIMSLHEEIAVVTKYFQIICEHLTHPMLNRSLIQFITEELLPTLIKRLNHMSVSITAATLRLFTVLFEFYCEDFWHAAILKFLVPQKHLMVSQRGTRLPDIDFHESSARFLSLIPPSVIDALGADTFTSHFVQYLNGESERLTYIDNMVNPIPVTSLSQPKSQPGRNISQDGDGTNDNKSTNLNVVYPFWKLKYDGTDSLDKCDLGAKNSDVKDSGIDVEPEQNSSVNSSGDLLSHPNAIPIGDPIPTPEFSMINLTPQPGSSSSTSEVPCSTETRKEFNCLSVATNSSEGYASMDSSNCAFVEGASQSIHIASFGPFLDSILVQLSTWENQNPEVSLALSELVSVLASSRIPLMNTILLDPNLTLQPSYVTVMQLLKRIRDDLDFRMKDVCTPQVIKSVWQAMNSTASSSPKDLSTSRRTSMTAVANPLVAQLSSSTSFGDNLGELRKRLSGGGTGVAIASAFHSVFGRKSSSPVAASGPRRSESTNSIAPQGYKYNNTSNNQPIPSGPANILATRAIIFSHWLLELGAIAQQLCWRQK